MAYLTAAKISEILAQIGPASLRRQMKNILLPEIATAIATDAAGVAEDMPETPGDVEANKIAQLGANKELDEVHAEAFYLGSGAGTLVSATAANINILDGATITTDELNLLDDMADEMAALSGMETELGLLSGLTADAGELNAIAVNPGVVAIACVRIEAAVEDEETVLIGDDTYEFDTHDSETVTEGNIAVDVSGGTTEKSQGTLTMDTQPTAGDTMTIGSTVYTFVPDGTANAEGEVNVGADLADAKTEVTAAIEGTDGYNVEHPLVTIAAWATNDLVISAKAGGTAGDAIATTETFTAVGNVFDAATLGTTNAGVDPTAAEASNALISAINASGTEPVVAKDIDDNEVLLLQEAVGADSTACSETMAGANNTVDATFLSGAAGAQLKVASIARVPTATEVATGNLHLGLDFVPSVVITQVRTTATGALVAWDGAMTITSGDNPYVTVDNSGGTDWSVNETVYILAFA